jgi:hypothetical protein
MKKLILAVLLLMLSTPVWAAPDADHDADRAAAAFSVVTPATDDYWILTDTSNSGRFAKVATSSVRAALGIGTSDNPTWNSGNFTGGNIAASNTQVTKKWITGLQYTANVTSVIHGGRHYICTSTHTASAAGTGVGTNEPGVGDDWATVWTLGVLGDNTIYTQDTEPAGGTDGDIWVDTNGTSGSRLYTREESTWVAQAGGGGGISHATSDGSYYASRNGAWAAIDSVFLAPTGSGSSLTVTATGFDGNLTSADNTLQEIAQKFDDIVVGGSAVTDATITTTDVTTNNASTTKHGWLLKATAPASGLYNYVGITNGETAYTNKALFDATNPANETSGASAVVGVATTAARRDHVHAMPTIPTVSDTAYNATSWDTNTDAPSKNAVRDRFEALLPSGADGEYGAWLTNNTVNPNTYSTGKTGFAYYNSIAYFCINGTCSAIGTNPMTASGDMVKGGTSGVPTRMIPASGVVSFLETSSSANLATALTDENTASGGICTNPMTTAGDLITGGASGAHTARIAAVATGSVLVSQGTSTAPAYSSTPLVTSIDIGNADTSIGRSAGGVITVESVVVPTISSSNTLTNKTLDANDTGNVVKGYGYVTFTKPHNRGSATTAVGTTETTQLYGVPIFADDVETNNYVDYIAIVPPDWDTTVDPVATLKFRLGGADTADHDYIVSMIDIVDSAAADGTPADAINLAYTADGSGASGDIETATATLTGWGAAATAGTYWLIRVTRDGDDGTNDASTVDSYPMSLTLKYGFSQ